MLKRELPFIADPKGLAWRDSSSQVLKCDCEEGSCVMGVGRQMESRDRTYRDRILLLAAKARVEDFISGKTRSCARKDPRFNEPSSVALSVC